MFNLFLIFIHFSVFIIKGNIAKSFMNIGLLIGISNIHNSFSGISNIHNSFSNIGDSISTISNSLFCRHKGLTIHNDFSIVANNYGFKKMNYQYMYWKIFFIHK